VVFYISRSLALTFQGSFLGCQNAIVVEELRICSLIGVVKISGVLWIGASKRVIKLNVVLLVGFEDQILLILIHETTIRITVKEGVPGSTL